MAKSKAASTARESAATRPVQVMRWRMLIGGIYLVAFLAQAGIATLVRERGSINPEEYEPLLVKLLTIYAVPAGVILGSIFAPKQTSRAAGPMEVWAVLILSCVWNAMLLGRYLLFAFGTEDNITQLGAFYDTVVPAGHFLSAAALAYLYGGHSS